LPLFLSSPVLPASCCITLPSLYSPFDPLSLFFAGRVSAGVLHLSKSHRPFSIVEFPIVAFSSWRWPSSLILSFGFFLTPSRRYSLTRFPLVLCALVNLSPCPNSPLDRFRNVCPVPLLFWVGFHVKILLGPRFHK